MKKLLIVMAVFIVYPSICFASYVIHLKDGRKVVTDRYWEEGDRIKFKQYGGVIGIQKDQVKEIDEIEDVPEEKAAAVKPETPSAAEKAGDVKKADAPEAAKKAKSAEQVKEQQKPGEISEEEKKKAAQEKAAKEAEFIEEKRKIMEEQKSASEAFKEAKAKKDKVAAKKHFQRIVSLREKLFELEKRVKAKFGGKLPDWWLE